MIARHIGLGMHVYIGTKLGFICVVFASILYQVPLPTKLLRALVNLATTLSSLTTFVQLLHPPRQLQSIAIIPVWKTMTSCITYICHVGPSTLTTLILCIGLGNWCVWSLITKHD